MRLDVSFNCLNNWLNFKAYEMPKSVQRKATAFYLRWYIYQWENCEPLVCEEFKVIRHQGSIQIIYASALPITVSHSSGAILNVSNNDFDKANSPGKHKTTSYFYGDTVYVVFVINA